MTDTTNPTKTTSAKLELFPAPEPSIKLLAPVTIHEARYLEEPALILQLQALVVLAGFRGLQPVEEPASLDLDRGYLGQFDFEEGRYHLIIPEIATIPMDGVVYC